MIQRFNEYGSVKFEDLSSLKSMMLDKLSRQLDKFSYQYLNITPDLIESIDSLIGDGTYRSVEKKSIEIVSKLRSVDIDYIYDRLIDLSDLFEYTSVQQIVTNSDIRFNTKDSYGTVHTYHRDMVNSDNFRDMVSAVIILGIITQCNKSEMSSHSIKYDFSRSDEVIKLYSAGIMIHIGHESNYANLYNFLDNDEISKINNDLSEIVKSFDIQYKKKISFIDIGRCGLKLII